MPCKCTGYRIDKCKCKVLRTGLCNERAGESVVLLSHSSSISHLLDLRAKEKPNLILRLIENCYETCAGYNLRYCPIRGFIKHDHYLSSTVKDLVILICFLVANFVVFIAILSKMMVHMYFVVIKTTQWIRRSFISKVDRNDEMVTLSPSPLYHDYSPPVTRFFDRTRAKCM